MSVELVTEHDDQHQTAAQKRRRHAVAVVAVGLVETDAEPLLKPS